MTDEKKQNMALTGRLLILAIAMFAFGFALVPLYDVFCEITGFGGRTNTEAVAVEEAPDLLARHPLAGVVPVLREGRVGTAEALGVADLERLERELAPLYVVFGEELLLALEAADRIRACREPSRCGAPLMHPGCHDPG